MDIVELTYNDDNNSIVRKSNINFRNLAMSLRSMMPKRQGVPAMGTYVISTKAPVYDGTNWQQVDTITTTGGQQIPIWTRTN